MIAKKICPGCKNEMFLQGKDYKCKCGFNFPTELYGVKLGINDLTALNVAGKTKIYTFTWTNGQKGQASLVYNRDTNRIGYEFVPTPKYIPRQKQVATV